MIFNYAAMLFCGISATVAQNEIPNSPCPEVFNYEQSGPGDWSGHIHVVILPSYQMPLKLVVEMTIPAYIRGDYAGKLVLKDNKDLIAQKIFRGDPAPINYKVLFPIRFPLPLVKNITLNQDVLCTGPEASGIVVTKIRLQHSLFPVTPLEVRPPPPDFEDLDLKPAPDRPFRPPEKPPNPFFPQTFKPATPPTRFTPSTLGPPRVPTTAITSSPSQATVVEISQKNPQNVNSEQCGRPVLPNLLVMNGLEPKRGEWPWLSALFMMNSDGDFVFHCSGTLINQKHVVTAAHCIKYRDRLELTTETLVVYLGKYNLEQVVEKESAYSELEEIHLHPDYNWKKYDADLALLVLKTTIKYNSYIQPACLWDFSPALEPIVGKLGTVVGWGRDEKGNQVTATPRMVRIPVVSQEDCLRSQPDFVLFTSSRTLCAGFRNGSGPCNGDSGGGLVIPMENHNLGKRWYLRGVVSLSLLDKSVYSCDLSQYVVYTDLAKYSSWLQSFLN